MLDELLSQEEGKTLEFKETANALPRILQTIVAFANTAGGTLIIGVQDKTKKVVGVSNITKEEERISNALASSVSPMLFPNFQFFTWRKKDVLVITVTHQPVPYFIKSQGMGKGVYIRLGSTNRVADKSTISEIRRLSHHESFDELPNLKATTDEIDFQMARDIFATVSKSFEMKKAKSNGLVVAYHDKFYPSNAGLLLFAKNIQDHFPDAVIRCGCFSGTTKTHIIDQQDIILPLPGAVEPIIAFIERHTATRSEIGRKQRKDISQYPIQVVREAVINAIVHADYSKRGSNIQVAVFADRIEITNPGMLPFGLSLEKALSGLSQLRNRVIGVIFRELGLIERWGSGLRRMIDICNEAGITEPKFEELDNFFRVTLYHETTKQKVSTPWEEMIIKHLSATGDIDTPTAAKIWGVTTRTASVRLRKMRDRGLITEISTSEFDPKKKYILSST
jgi:ATP-dependent DNA helicase RecG